MLDSSWMSGSAVHQVWLRVNQGLVTGAAKNQPRWRNSKRTSGTPICPHLGVIQRHHQLVGIHTLVLALIASGTNSNDSYGASGLEFGQVGLLLR